MVIKKYIAKSENSALEQAKAELGEALVVMNVKKVRPSGWFSFLRKKLVEVTVALEDDSEEPLRQLRRIAIAQDKAMNGEKAKTSGNANQDSAAVASAAKAIEEAGKRTGIGPEKKKEATLDLVANDELAISQSKIIEEKLDSLQTLLESKLSGDLLESKDSLEDHKSEKKGDTGSEKESEKKDEDLEFDRFLRLVYNTLIENEVDERYANVIIQDAEKNRKPGATMDFLLGTVYQKLILKFGKNESIIPSENGPKLIFFLGPTGVGKTTTIAKIASSFSVHENKKVALLTADTYRIAATEQLRTYAGILEVPFRVIYTTEDLSDALADFKDMDYIFVDTAGHSQQNDELLDKQKEFIEAAKEYLEVQCFLVLSATTKLRDLQNIVQKYKTIDKYQLIFTKLDETDCIGNLLNISLYSESPISYVTYGQNVPNDIEIFNAQKTVKQLLGGKHAE